MKQKYIQVNSRMEFLAKLMIGKTILIMLMACTMAHGQNTWTAKHPVGAPLTLGRSSATGLSIGQKGYIGMGFSGTTPIAQKDFWEYNPASDVWTQKADFGGGVRTAAVAFSIGTKGYVGAGTDATPAIRSDFWEYAPSSNVWTKKDSLFINGSPGGPLQVGFSIGTKGYIYLGGRNMSAPGNHNFGEYDQTSGTWTVKKDGPSARAGAVGFSIGNKGYIGTGAKSPTWYNEFWEYDQPTDTWAQKTSFAGTARYNAAGFSIGNKGYIGTGDTVGNGSGTRDFWEYDQSTDVWTKKANYGGVTSGVSVAVGFSIGNKGYIGTGGDGPGTFNKYFYVYSDTVTTTGIENFSIPDVKIFSHSSLIYFEFPEQANVTLYNLSGQTIYHNSFSAGQFTLPCDAGFYLVRVVSGNQIINKKIVTY